MFAFTSLLKQVYDLGMKSFRIGERLKDFDFSGLWLGIIMLSGLAGTFWIIFTAFKPKIVNQNLRPPEPIVYEIIIPADKKFVSCQIDDTLRPWVVTRLRKSEDTHEVHELQQMTTKNTEKSDLEYYKNHPSTLMPPKEIFRFIEKKR